MLLGAGSMVLALVEPQQAGIQTGFIASSIGITAIVIGRRLVKDRYRSGTVARAFGRGGAILGTVGTALMAYAVLGAGLTVAGVHLPALSLPIESGRTVIGGLTPVDVSAAGADQPAGPSAPPASATPASPAQAAAEPAAGAPAGTPQTADVPTPTSFEAERAEVMQTAGTLSFVLRKDFGSGPFPASLAVLQGAPDRILLPDGTAPVALPDGARMLYSSSADGSAWSVTIIGSRFGATATYSSSVGTVQGG